MPRPIAEAISMASFNQSKFSHINVADVLAARKDILKLGKVSSDPPETRSAANAMTKVKISGRVPDRGGRPSEMAAPPPEMPSWQQRSGQSHDARNFQKRGGGGGNKNYKAGYGGDRGNQGQSADGGYQGGHGGGRHRNKGVQGAGWKKY